MTDDWHDYETNPPATQDLDSEWIEGPIRCKMKGNGTVRGFVKRPPGRSVRIVGSGDISVLRVV